jgi:hypothetical protein
MPSFESKKHELKHSSESQVELEYIGLLIGRIKLGSKYALGDKMLGTLANKMSVIDCALHRLWVRVRRPFAIPKSICMHAASWEIYDMHLAGCTKCGSMHLCTHATCPTSTNHEGHSICNITGLCTKMLNFSNLEYIDTVQPILHHQSCHEGVAVPRAPRLSRKKRFKMFAANKLKKRSVVCKDYEQVDDMINKFVWDVLCSEAWTVSSAMEYKRYTSKWTNSFTKVIAPSQYYCHCAISDQ